MKVEVPGEGRVTVDRHGRGPQGRERARHAKKAGTVTVKLSKVRKSLKGKTLTLKLTFSGVVVTKALKVR